MKYMFSAPTFFNNSTKLTRFAFTALVLFSLSLRAIAQEDEPLKNFRFGLRVSPEISWLKPSDVKKLDGAGAKFKLGYALMTEFRLNKVVSLATGIGFEKNGGSLSYTDTARYLYHDDAPLEIKSDTSGISKTTEAYQLKTRNFSIAYWAIPITLKMRTKEIGVMTYFGQAGVNIGIRTKAIAKDDVLSSKNSSTSLDDINISSDMSIFKAAINVGAGAEYNLAGSTSLVFSVNYLNGLTNVSKSKSDYLYRSDRSAYKQKFTNNAVSITVGVLF
ncbi:MAG: outer membrane beta-barrel protein [Bacteroidetes bacterium]|nr:outer membrane beta-barrel protein [Bacteroidota bacterium]